MVQMLLRKKNGMNKYAILHAANSNAKIPPKKVKLGAALGLSASSQSDTGGNEKCVCDPALTLPPPPNDCRGACSLQPPRKPSGSPQELDSL